MLTEENRIDLIKDLKENITFKYKTFEPNVNIMRHVDGLREKFPYVTVQFLPANRSKFRSVGDVIGKATENGQYLQYGYCQLEQVNIYCYTGEYHNNNQVKGRLLGWNMAEEIRLYILRNWEQLLWNMYASFDRSEDFNRITDLSFYDYTKESMIYCYNVSFMLRTQVRWNKVPSDFETEDIIEKVGLYDKSTNEDEYSLTKRIDVSED